MRIPIVITLKGIVIENSTIQFWKADAPNSIVKFDVIYNTLS